MFQTLAISSTSKDTIPLEFIQPAVTNAQDALKLTDVRVIYFAEPNDETTVRLITEASRDWGVFLYDVNMRECVTSEKKKLMYNKSEVRKVNSHYQFAMINMHIL